jgi:tRNA-specific 2-thiouridylase
MLLKNSLTAADASWIAGAPSEGVNLSGKTRYRQADSPCTLSRVLDSEVKVDFPASQWAVTPGQSVVLYDGEVCLGGGIIT